MTSKPESKNSAKDVSPQSESAKTGEDTLLSINGKSFTLKEARMRAWQLTLVDLLYNILLVQKDILVELRKEKKPLDT